MAKYSMRPQCSKCHSKPCAVNYIRKGKRYYRRFCDSCQRKLARLAPRKISKWESAGYKKKPACEKCGFKSIVIGQLVVYLLDDDLRNISAKNLRTVCLNCNAELALTGWRQGDLIEDR